MTELFHIVLYKPFLNALLFLYGIVGHDMGIAIIVLTIVIKLILFIPSLSSIRAQKNLQEMQPKLDELKAKYKDNQEQLGKELMKFYKENKVNPLSSCLPLLIQLPILIALYKAFFGGLKTDPNTGILIADQLQYLYAPLRDIFTTQPLNTTFLQFFDLAKSGNYLFAILAGASQFISSWIMQAKKKKTVPSDKPKKPEENVSAAINKQMVYFLPIITVIFGVQFPAGVTLYWLISTLFTLGQQLFFMRKTKKDEEIKNTLDITPTS